MDKNSYYGGPEAAFSLQEAHEWVDSLHKGSHVQRNIFTYLVCSPVVTDPGREPFEDASIYSPADTPGDGKKMSSSRAYSLSLSPQLVYARSKLLPTLVSSKVYRQLEFQAVGSWWIYGNSLAAAPAEEESSAKSSSVVSGQLRRVPSSREDIFADDTISMKSKRMLIRFLRNINQPQQTSEGIEQPSIVEEEYSDMFLSEYLSSKFNAPPELYSPIHSLSLCQQNPHQTRAKLALPRIQRHLASLGVFGSGFGSLIAKWGGGSEIVQVGCRALAVGGGVYVLGQGVQSVDTSKAEDGFYHVKLSNGEQLRTRYIVGSPWDLPAEAGNPPIPTQKASRSISVVSSPLRNLFPVTAEGGPIPAGAVIFISGEALSSDTADAPPVYLLFHSSETGECPDGQCKLMKVSLITRHSEKMNKAPV